jgi:membrane protease YdiL (CAAX protease family)
MAVMIPSPFINSQHRLRNGWWIAIFFIVLAALLFPLLLLSRGEGASPPIWQQALVVISASMICQALRRRPLADLAGRIDFIWLQHLILGAGLGATLMFAPATLLWATGQAHFALNPSGAHLLLSALALFAAVAVTEEVLFRGFIFQRLLDGLGEWPAQVLIGALFLLTHMDAIQNAGPIGYLAGVNIFFASLMLGLAFIRTKSLAMPVGIHFAANFVQGSVLGFGVSGSEEQGLLAPTLAGSDWLTGGAFGLEASIPGLVSVTALTVALYLWRPAAPREVETE